MKIGLLNKIVSIKERSFSPDGLGGETESFTTIATNIKASIRQLSGQELINNAKVSVTKTHRIYLEYSSSYTLTTSSIIVCDTIEYEIKDINNVMMMDSLIQVDCEIKS